jgi:hypothetical protein
LRYGLSFPVSLHNTDNEASADSSGIMAIARVTRTDLIDNFRTRLAALSLENQVPLIVEIFEPFVQHDVALPPRIEMLASHADQTA